MNTSRRLIMKRIFALLVVGCALAGGLHMFGAGALIASPQPPAPRQPIAAAPASARPQPAAAAAPVRTAAIAAPAVAPAPAEQGYVIKRILPIEGPMRMGDHVWDDSDVPPGKLVITVDLEAQTMSVFRDGYEIGAAAILYGSDEKPTPLGVYPITQKKADHVSNIYGSPMPYMLRMTNDGISIHGAEVDDGFATHGCIGVPTAFARKLFGAVKLGDVVIVTRGKLLSLGETITAA